MGFSNSFPIATNVKKKAKSLSTFEFSSLYTTVFQKLSILYSNFKSENALAFLKHLSIYKGTGRRYFTKEILVNAMSFLIKKYLFTIGNMFFKQDIGISIHHHFMLNSFFTFFNMTI